MRYRAAQPSGFAPGSPAGRAKRSTGVAGRCEPISWASSPSDDRRRSPGTLARARRRSRSFVACGKLAGSVASPARSMHSMFSLSRTMARSVGRHPEDVGVLAVEACMENGGPLQRLVGR
jgi:hypothetical protein